VIVMADQFGRTAGAFRRAAGSTFPTPASAMTAVKPDPIGVDERLAEIAEILALGLIRMRARMSSPFLPTSGEIWLDCNACRSGPDPDSPWEIKP
jgi:hypothetical protein